MAAPAPAAAPPAAELRPSSSSLEAMLELLMRKAEGQKNDTPPRLPARPPSRGRRASPRKFALANGVAPEGCVAGSAAAGDVAEKRPPPLLRSPAADADKIADGNGDGEYCFKQEIDMVPLAVASEYERRAQKAEEELKLKDGEIAALKQQLQQSEAQRSELKEEINRLEAKLQQSKAAASPPEANQIAVPKSAPAVNPTTGQDAFAAALAEAQTPSSAKLRSSSAAAAASPGSAKKEFLQQKHALDGDHKKLNGGGGGGAQAGTAGEELKKLKAQFMAWKKEFRARLSGGGAKPKPQPQPQPAPPSPHKEVAAAARWRYWWSNKNNKKD